MCVTRCVSLLWLTQDSAATVLGGMALGLAIGGAVVLALEWLVYGGEE